MRLRSVIFDDDESPETITVEMSVREAAFLAKLIGGRSAADNDLVIPCGGDHGDQIYYCLSSMFNRFYEDGVDDALESVRST